jgi:hypothetical protein
VLVVPAAEAHRPPKRDTNRVARITPPPSNRFPQNPCSRQPSRYSCLKQLIAFGVGQLDGADPAILDVYGHEPDRPTLAWPPEDLDEATRTLDHLVESISADTAQQTQN